MKILIVNGDDFGYTKGVNQGIILAHQKGILTSTSVMVDGIAAEEAKNLLSYPKFSVGLHFAITKEGLQALLMKLATLSFSEIKAVEKEFNRQVEKFVKITGKLPDHLDSHHTVHLHPKVRPIFENFSQRHHCPVRAFGGIRWLHSFYGWNKLRQTDLGRISVDSLLKILKNLKDGINELMCHPGLVDENLRKISRYLEEREVELKTLTDQRLADYINESDIKLRNWKEISV